MESQDEPIFTAVARKDSALQQAYDNAAATIPLFIELIGHSADSFCSAKLRFKDPDESNLSGQDVLLFMWLTAVSYHQEERYFSGTFFEVPAKLQKWHQVGQRLSFDPEDIFDWMVLRDGHLQGGFTLRINRERLPEEERDSYDRCIGVDVYEPLPI